MTYPFAVPIGFLNGYHGKSSQAFHPRSLLTHISDFQVTVSSSYPVSLSPASLILKSTSTRTIITLSVLLLAPRGGLLS